MEVEDALFDLGVYDDDVVRYCPVVISIIINEIITLKWTVVLLKAAVEGDMELALSIMYHALIWVVDVAVFVEAVNVPHIGFEHFRLRELPKYTSIFPLIRGWIQFSLRIILKIG